MTRQYRNSRETVPSDFYSSFGPWLLHGFARTESYSISLNEDRYKLLCEKFQQTIYFQGISREESVYPRPEG